MQQGSKPLGLARNGTNSLSSSGHPFKGWVPASVDVALLEGHLGAV